MEDWDLKWIIKNKIVDVEMSMYLSKQILNRFPLRILLPSEWRNVVVVLGYFCDLVVVVVVVVEKRYGVSEIEVTEGCSKLLPARRYVNVCCGFWIGK